MKCTVLNERFMETLLCAMVTLFMRSLNDTMLLLFLVIVLVGECHS